MRRGVEIETVLEAYDIISAFNKADLSEIVVIADSKILELDPEKLSEWELTGLSNLDYFRMNDEWRSIYEEQPE